MVIDGDIPSGKYVYITMERPTMLWMGKLTNFRLGHGFNSYVRQITGGYTSKWLVQITTIDHCVYGSSN